MAVLGQFPGPVVSAEQSKRSHMDSVVVKPNATVARPVELEYRAPQLPISSTEFIYEKVLGLGSYSKVLKAAWKATGEDVALKIMDKHHIIREKKAAYVKLERQVLDQLDHPGVVKLFFTFQDDFSLYMGLEYCGGGELFEQIRLKERMTEEDARFYASELVEALEYIHSQGVIHRDLKPENVLLSTAGHVKLADFGCAKLLRPLPNGAVDNTPDKRNQSFVGTAEYVSPEVLNGEPVTFAPPFKAASEYLCFQKVLSRDFVMPAHFSQHASDLIDRLLEVDPEKRLGAGPDGHRQLKAHPFFQGLQWGSLAAMPPPPLAHPPAPKEGESEDPYARGGMHDIDDDWELAQLGGTFSSLVSSKPQEPLQKEGEASSLSAAATIDDALREPPLKLPPPPADDPSSPTAMPAAARMKLLLLAPAARDTTPREDERVPVPPPPPAAAAPPPPPAAAPPPPPPAAAAAAAGDEDHLQQQRNGRSTGGGHAGAAATGATAAEGEARLEAAELAELQGGAKRNNSMDAAAVAAGGWRRRPVDAARRGTSMTELPSARARPAEAAETPLSQETAWLRAKQGGFGGGARGVVPGGGLPPAPLPPQQGLRRQVSADPWSLAAEGDEKKGARDADLQWQAISQKQQCCRPLVRAQSSGPSFSAFLGTCGSTLTISPPDTPPLSPLAPPTPPRVEAHQEDQHHSSLPSVDLPSPVATRVASYLVNFESMDVSAPGPARDLVLSLTDALPAHAHIPKPNSDITERLRCQGSSGSNSSTRHSSQQGPSPRPLYSSPSLPVDFSPPDELGSPPGPTKVPLTFSERKVYPMLESAEAPSTLRVDVSPSVADADATPSPATSTKSFLESTSSTTLLAHSPVSRKKTPKSWRRLLNPAGLIRFRSIDKHFKF
eukprot:jgi/Mesen1/4497/ME000023S03871